MKLQFTLDGKLETGFETVGNPSGLEYDTIARACGAWTMDEMFNNNIDYVDEARTYALEHFNYERAYIALLNERPIMLPKQLQETYYKQPLKAGAYFALAEPILFAESLEKWKDECRSCILAGNKTDCEKLAGCEELGKAIADAERSANEELSDLFFNGDRYSDGLESRIMKELGGDIRVSIARSGSTMCTIDDFDNVKESLEDALGCTELHSDNIADAVADYINERARSKWGKIEQNRAERHKEREWVREYQEKQKQERENERVATLKAMTK